MELIGFQFFAWFVDTVWLLRWPLAAVFVFFAARQVYGFARGERMLAGMMFAYFFLVITSFWILKPLKKGIFIGFYENAGGLEFLGMSLDSAQVELLAKVANMFVAVAAVYVFTLLSRHARRARLTLILGAGFIAAYGVFAPVLGDPGPVASWLFYLFGDLFSTLMVAGFFAFLNDSVTPDTAKRLYGFVGLGGVVGGFFGSTVLGANVDRVSAAGWMGICALIALLIIAAALVAGRHAQTVSEARLPQEHKRPQGNAALTGARLVAASKYLLAVVAIVGLYEMVSTIMDFQFTAAVTHHLSGEDIGAHFPRVFAFTNMMALVVQLFLTRYVMTRFGVGAALAVLPAAALFGSIGFLIAPVLLIGSFLNTTDNAFAYSINQSAKEALYVPTTADEKYAAKAFIDMFVQRAAKALAVGLSLLITVAFAGFESKRWLSLVTMIILMVWLAAVRYAGRAFRERSKGVEETA